MLRIPFHYLQPLVYDHHYYGAIDVCVMPIYCFLLYPVTALTNIERQQHRSCSWWWVCHTLASSLFFSLLFFFFAVNCEKCVLTRTRSPLLAVCLACRWMYVRSFKCVWPLFVLITKWIWLVYGSNGTLTTATRLNGL